MSIPVFLAIARPMFSGMCLDRTRVSFLEYSSIMAIVLSVLPSLTMICSKSLKVWVRTEFTARGSNLSLFLTMVMQLIAGFVFNFSTGLFRMRIVFFHTRSKYYGMTSNSLGL